MMKIRGQKFRLMFFYCVFAVLPVLVIFFYFYQDIYNRMEDELLSVSRRSLSRAADTIDKEISHVLDISNKIYAHNDLYGFLEKEYFSPIQYLHDYNQLIVPFMRVLLSSNTSVWDICVYTDNSSVISGGLIRRLDEISGGSYFAADISDITEAGIFTLNRGRYYPHYKDGLLFSYLRKMSSKRNSGKFMKIIKIDFETDMLRQILGSEDFKGTIDIIDEQGVIRCSTDPGREMTVYQSAETDRNEPSITSADIAVAKLDGWRLIGVLDVDYIKGSLNTKRNIAALLLAVSVMFLVGLIYRLVNAIFTSRLTEAHIVTQKKQAELIALKNQLDPHFLFNILENVRMKLLLAGQKNHSAVIMRMAKLYRKILSWGDDVITASDEAEFIREYMAIQNYRYEDTLVWTLDVSHCAENFKLPKMLLHTFVENACKHGMNENGGETRIDISISLLNGYLLFTVKDNGPGFSQEEKFRFFELFEKIPPEPEDLEKSDGIGINNALSRLRLYYGGSFKLTLDTKENEGSAIEILLPPME